MAACGGCTAKLPPGMLRESLSNIPTFYDKNLLVGFDSSDDGAVYKLSDDIAMIKTLDFFPPMVSDPYVFGQIAATNALSDVYAMGGEVKVALNIVAFPENEDPGILAAILQGGAEKVKEAGGVLCGGHSISDATIKYGLSVTGIAHPDHVMYNNRCNIGDKIILTKPLGIGMVTSAYNAGAASQEAFDQAIQIMTTLNKHGIQNASSMTDVTGFGFLGHLNEMVTPQYSIVINSQAVPFISEAAHLAQEFLLTAAGQKNRKFLHNQVQFENVPDYMQEILFDPQTSGGLLIAINPAHMPQALASQVVGEVVPRLDTNILVR